MDMLLRQPFPPNKPHSDMRILGYRFVFSHISTERAVEDDIEVDTTSRELFAVETDNGFNFYVKDGKTFKHEGDF
jgi:hypothetical protein